MPFFNLFNWYWSVGNGPAGELYSSAAAAFVPTTDAGYAAWLGSGNTPTKIDTVADLMAYLNANYPNGTPYGAFIAGGVTVTSPTYPALNGVYAIDTGMQAKIAQEASFIGSFQEFTTGATTNRPWPLANGAIVQWPTTAQFLAFAKAVGQLIGAADTAQLQGAAMPPATIALP